MPDGDVTAALKYTGDGAPQVVAAGKGHIAATILARAHEAGVPVHLALGNHDEHDNLRAALGRFAGNGLVEGRCAAVIETPRANWSVVDWTRSRWTRIASAKGWPGGG